MGWIKKKLRQLDRRVRKIFGKKAWLKVAALVAGTYMGVTGKGTGAFGGTGTGVAPVSSAAKGSKFAQFFTNLTAGLKNVFTFGKGAPAAPGTGTPTTAGTPPLTPKTRFKNWLRDTAASTATDLVKGYIKEEIDPTFETGQYAAIGSAEPRSIYDIAQTAYNNQYCSIDLMDAYRNIDYGTASTTTVDNLLPLFVGGNLGRRGISVYKDTSTPISQLS